MPRELDVERLEAFFIALLQEAYLLEAAYCRAAHVLAPLASDEPSALHAEEWVTLNCRLAALGPAPESRVAGAMLGRCLLQLVL